MASFWHFLECWVYHSVFYVFTVQGKNSPNDSMELLYRATGYALILHYGFSLIVNTVVWIPVVVCISCFLFQLSLCISVLCTRFSMYYVVVKGIVVSYFRREDFWERQWLSFSQSWVGADMMTEVQGLRVWTGLHEGFLWTGSTEVQCQWTRRDWCGSTRNTFKEGCRTRSLAPTWPGNWQCVLKPL